MQLDNKEKGLGIWFQNNLKFDEHINYVVNRSNKLLGLIKRTFKALDKEFFLILYKSLIRSILDYGGSVYYLSTKKNIQLIENIQRRATRILPELRGLTYSERLESLKLPTLLYRRKRHDLIQSYKIVYCYEDVKPEKGALAIRRIFSLADMITKPKFSNCPNVLELVCSGSKIYIESIKIGFKEIHPLQNC